MKLLNDISKEFSTQNLIITLERFGISNLFLMHTYVYNLKTGIWEVANETR